MTLSLAVTAAGLGTAVYLERSQELSAAVAPFSGARAPVSGPAAPEPAPVASISVQSEERADPMAAAAAVPATVAPPLAAAVTTPPSPDAKAGSSAPPFQPRSASQAPPSIQAESREEIAPPPLSESNNQVAALPPATAVTPPAETMAREPPVPQATTVEVQQYWVEYGVFIGERYAKRLQQTLAGLGIETIMAPAKGRDGRHLIRVRSAQPVSYEVARAAAQTAQASLRIDTLVHRNSAASAIAKAPGPSPQPVMSSGTSISPLAPYWVQFAAYPHHHQALRFQQKLASQGIDTMVISGRGTSGRVLYYVRSVGFADRQSALEIGHRGKQAINTDFLVGQSASHSVAPIPRPKPLPTAAQAGISAED